MEIGNRTYETPKMDVHQGLTAGAVAGGTIGTIKALAPQLKDSFSKSVQAQKDVISQFKDSGKTVDEYIAPLKKKIDIIADPGSVQKTMNDIQQKGLHDKLKGFRTKYAEVVEGGTKKAYKEIDKTQKLLQSGKPSKLTAIKESASAFASKAAAKMGGLKTSIQEGYTYSTGVKGKYKAIKDAIVNFVNQTPSVKKAGKFALIGAAFGLGAALIGKAVSGGKEE